MINNIEKSYILLTYILRVILQIPHFSSFRILYRLLGILTSISAENPVLSIS